MSENSFFDRSMTIVSLVLLVFVVAAFVWLWFGSQRPSAEIYKSAENLEPVTITGVESRAKTLLEGLKNNAAIPIPEPTGKEGRTDPFAAL
ncbi:hypothetical protein CO019_01100 [Candidatus Berkelbacteria bacterium CG_4_9_14_0_2_um_filter_42_30]|uniref:Uncharacterized protein n=6 Tax=Candidatus Berkelbacteria TaxID=1618330 RepID=A0A2M7K0Z4_9BACT|nr:MAG: hypothetical protein AUJ40_03075 [Candidatus Berkelbacteria bacterium CG1_02_42_45]PIP50783.1 MAG: hypothetical protein COX11_02290 [Candidatus Berkelbacteria bacterium CG23_combo_of_CG06-09_8_20_14_all_41_73]PIR27128.1 MAG: hypothetical protein COV40_02565 [Candidatus Berkelbacteria bacterium CG11_big_fil_rev_8_21_14_0_20_42_15]PIX29928.1 MAG: hypothetical protein COZ63_02465 [Candidatus Berkelbacteria bacterium CG_4_8_14_3_um_filter_42_13]PIZ27427.1 MAG: hypothetical protein COY45_025